MQEDGDPTGGPLYKSGGESWEGSLEEGWAAQAQRRGDLAKRVQEKQTSSREKPPVEA